MICRISGKNDLIPVIDLGEQAYTGFFPKNKEDLIPSGSLSLGLSKESGLLQMISTFDPSIMYGSNYGYRSGLNKTMVKHLCDTSDYLTKIKPLVKGDVCLDIGSNDATFLKSIKESGIIKVGIDPNIEKFQDYYPPEIYKSSAFFSSSEFFKLSIKKASIITSIAMFYDLDDPVEFARQVNECLTDDGIWFFEQSYMPLMLDSLSFDTICHEHYEYYSLSTIKYILDKAGLYIADVIFNDMNGGSFGIIARKESKPISKKTSATINWVLEKERRLKLNTPSPYIEFSDRVAVFREELVSLINNLKNSGAMICGIGASTKGNVLLQYCNLSSNEINCIGDVNEDKFGCYTPGSLIPIVSEFFVLESKPDYLLILPWHFKDHFIERFKDFRLQGGKLIFPLPRIQIL